MNPTTRAAEVAANFHQPTSPAGIVLVVLALVVVMWATIHLTAPRPVLPECEECGQPIKGEPIHDEDEVYWRRPGMELRTWCSTECLSDSSEAYWTARWSA